MEAAKLLSSLLKLRQACCHPQVGSFGLRSLQQAPMTMDEILKVCKMSNVSSNLFERALSVHSVKRDLCFYRFL